VLADEPTGNLHSDQARDIMRLFQRLNAEGHDDRPGHPLRGERGGGHRVVRLKDGWLEP
jgi:ABC-type ATPase involved in cell division